MNKILVTGAGGFIGSHLTEMLIQKGYNVRAFIHYNSFNSWGWLDYAPDDIKKTLDIFTGDIRDPYGVRKAMDGCNIVLHLAALIGIPYSYHSPDTYVDTNIKGTLNVVQAARDLDIDKIIHTSTSEVYGTAQFVPITEDHPLQGQSPYSASKIGADQIAMSFYNAFETPVATIRPFNTYGPRQSARAVIPTIITQIVSGNKMIKIGSLHPTRDFNFIDDTARAYISAINSDDCIGNTINIGNNFEISIGDTARLIAEIMDVYIETGKDDQRVRPEKSEVERLWADNSRAKNLIGWEPKYAGIEGFKQGLRKTIDWYMDPENIKKYKVNLYNI